MTPEELREKVAGTLRAYRHDPLDLRVNAVIKVILEPTLQEVVFYGPNWEDAARQISRLLPQDKQEDAA